MLDLTLPGGLELDVGVRNHERRRRLLEWLGKGLRPGRPGRLLREYPLLFARESTAIPISLWRGDRPLSACVLWPAHFRIGTSRLRTGVVSLVYTDTEMRRQGLAARVVAAAVEAAATHDLGLTLLWSEQDALYRAAGFEPIGTETLLHLDADTSARAEQALASRDDATPLLLSRPRGADWQAIAAMRSTRPCGLDFSGEDLTRLSAIPDTSTWIAKAGDTLAGFAMRGRGDDLTEVIHEWGGEPAAALHCCRALMRELAAGREGFLLAPVSRTPLAWALRRAGARRIERPLVWARIAGEEALAADLSTWLDTSLTLTPTAPTTLEPLPTRRRFDLQTDLGRSGFDQKTLLTCFLGDPAGAALDAERVRLRALLPAPTHERIPMPFFVWGLESI